MSALSSQPDGREFSLTIEGDLSPTHLVAFQGREKLHAGARFSLSCVFAPGAAPADVAELIGRRALLAFTGHDEPRRIAGRIRRVVVDSADSLGQVRATLVMVSELLQLEDRRTRRIFREMSSVEIVRQLLGEHGIAHAFEITGSYPSRDLCVQYAETDLAFISRLVAEEGLCLYVRDLVEGMRAEVVVTDQIGSFRRLPGDPVLVVPRGSSSDPEIVLFEHHLRQISLDEVDGSDAVHLRHYDPMRPNATLASTARWDRGRLPG